MKKKLSIISMICMLLLVNIPFTSKASGNALILGISQNGNTVTVTVGGPTNYMVQYQLSGYDGILQPTDATNGIFDGTSGAKGTHNFTIVKSGTVKIQATVNDAFDASTVTAVNCEGASATVTVKTQADINAEQAAAEQASREEESRKQAAAAEQASREAESKKQAEEASRQQSIAQSIAQAEQQAIRQSEAESIRKVEEEQKARDESIRLSVEAEEAKKQSIQASINAQTSSEDISEESSSLESTEDTSEKGNKDASNVVTLTDGTKLILVNSLDNIELPEGFEAKTIEVNGESIAVAQSKDGILLVYLTEQDNSNGNFYVYNRDTKTAIPYAKITSSSDTYTFLVYEGQDTSTQGLKETTLTVDGKEIPAWLTGENSGIYIVYAMNSKGVAGFYRYDIEEGTVLRYIPDGSVGNAEDMDGYAYDLSVEQSKYTELNNKYNHDMMFRFIFIVGLIVLSIILIFVIIVLVVKLKYRDDEKDEDEDDYFDSDYEEQLEERAEEEADEELEEEMKEIDTTSSNETMEKSQDELDLEFLTKKLSDVGTEAEQVTLSDNVSNLSKNQSNDVDSDDDFEIVDFSKENQ